MKNNFYSTLAFVLALICANWAGAQCGGSTNALTTYYASNNGQRGVMFDISATQEVTIMCFDANLYAGTTANYEIYYRPGTFVGNENNSAAWTLLGSTTGLTSAGNNVGTNIPIPVLVPIPAGQTYAFYITNDFGGGTSYTDGTAAGVVLGSDANISVLGGIGKSYPFGLTFNYREFNGTVHYSPGSSLGVELLNFDVRAKGRNVLLEWSTSSETNNDYFMLERSSNASEWAVLDTVQGQGTTDNISSYYFEDKNVEGDLVYYRLSQVDFDGTQSEYSVRAAELNYEATAGNLVLAPNPSSDITHIAISKDEMGEPSVYNLSGQKMEVEYSMGENGITLDINSLESGIYIVWVNNRSTLLEVID